MSPKPINRQNDGSRRPRGAGKKRWSASSRQILEMDIQASQIRKGEKKMINKKRERKR